MGRNTGRGKVAYSWIFPNPVKAGPAPGGGGVVVVIVVVDIAKLVGVLIKVDFATNSISRACYAHVCVEISLAKPLISKILVVNGWQQIEYENLDLLGMSCGIVGHLHGSCPLVKGGRCSKDILPGGRSDVALSTMTSNMIVEGCESPDSRLTSGNVSYVRNTNISDQSSIDWVMITTRKKTSRPKGTGNHSRTQTGPISTGLPSRPAKENTSTSPSLR